ncbi:MAG TPA: cupredoxin family copper-binding protein [Rhodanobacteraceae bacterium]
MNRVFLHPRTAIFGAVALAAAVTVSNAIAAEPVRIEIQKFAFQPKEITIAPGTTVVWVNHDETPHTIAAGDQTFVSQALDTDDRYEHTFANEGDVEYFCTVHPFMVGVVHVLR